LLGVSRLATPATCSSPLARTSGASAARARFEALCGASPIAIASGKRGRYRLKPGGDRQANPDAAYDRRLRSCPKTRAYAERSATEGKTKDTIRCLERYIVREIYTTPAATSTAA
jgi:hypothetical protein